MILDPAERLIAGVLPSFRPISTCWILTYHSSTAQYNARAFVYYWMYNKSPCSFVVTEKSNLKLIQICDRSFDFRKFYSIIVVVSAKRLNCNRSSNTWPMMNFLSSAKKHQQLNTLRRFSNYPVASMTSFYSLCDYVARNLQKRPQVSVGSSESIVFLEDRTWMRQHFWKIRAT